MVWAGWGDGSGSEGGKGGGLKECGWCWEEVEDKGGVALGMDVEGKWGGWGLCVFGGGAEAIEYFAEGKLEGAGMVGRSRCWEVGGVGCKGSLLGIWRRCDACKRRVRCGWIEHCWVGDDTCRGPVHAVQSDV